MVLGVFTRSHAHPTLFLLLWRIKALREVILYYPTDQQNITNNAIVQDGYEIFIRQRDTAPILLHRFHPGYAERYLGVRIAITGQMDTEYEYRVQTAKEYGQRIIRSSLTKHETLVSYRAIWLSQINYCLPLTTFSLEQCHKIQSPVFQATLPRLGINRNFPRAVLYGPTR